MRAGPGTSASPEPVSEPRMLVAAVVATAGMEALRAFVGALSPGAPLACIIVRRPHPGSRSGGLAGALAASTSYRTQEIRNGMPVQAGCIFVAPSGRRVVVVEGRFRVSRGAGVGSASDFEALVGSLAAGYVDRSAVVVLGEEGAAPTPGLDGIRAAGGCVLSAATAADMGRELSRLAGAGGEAELREAMLRQQAILDSLPAQIALLDARGVIIAVNRDWEEQSGGAGLNYLEQCDRAQREGFESAQAIGQGTRRVLAGEVRSCSVDYPCQAASGKRWRRCLVTAVADPGAGRAVVMHVDISELVLLSEQLARQSAALHSAVNAIFVTDGEGTIDWANDALTRLSGYPAEQIVGRDPSFLEAPGNLRPFREVLAECQRSGQPWAGEVLSRTKSGRVYTVQQSITPIRSKSGEVAHFVVIQDDITRHKQVQERMLYMAEHDDLTGLWNRKSFTERLTESIDRARAAGSTLAVLLLDLDRFKDTNETLGHLAGDQVLLEVAHRLRQNLRENDLLARFGGDEFAILLEALGPRETITHVVERVLNSFRRPLEIGGRSLIVSASVGITVFPDDGGTAEELLRNADVSMHCAKADGRRNYRYYDPKLESELNERVSIERELIRFLGTRDLWIAFQPQWDLRGRRLVGAESLLRWNSTKHRDIPMDRVVAIAEESGIILPLGQWILEDSIAELDRWRSRGLDLRLSVNLSAVQFHQQDVFAMIMKALEGRGLAASLVKVEITESVLLNRSVRVKEALHALHGAGVGLVLDDFGTGYSSLTYLQRFPIETVKIDASFLAGIGRNKNDEAIVSGIIKMAHSLGLTVVAEGVESEVQMGYLEAAGCDLAQGFLFAEPLPAEEFERYLAGGQASGFGAAASGS